MLFFVWLILYKLTHSPDSSSFRFLATFLSLGSTKDTPHFLDWEFKFNAENSSGQVMSYFKCPRALDLDASEGDYGKVVWELEDKVGVELEAQALMWELEVLDLAEAVSHLDVLLCFADVRYALRGELYSY